MCSRVSLFIIRCASGRPPSLVGGPLPLTPANLLYPSDSGVPAANSGGAGEGYYPQFQTNLQVPIFRHANCPYDKHVLMGWHAPADLNVFFYRFLLNICDPGPNPDPASEKNIINTRTPSTVAFMIQILSLIPPLRPQQEFFRQVVSSGVQGFRDSLCAPSPQVPMRMVEEPVVHQVTQPRRDSTISGSFCRRKGDDRFIFFVRSKKS